MKSGFLRKILALLVGTLLTSFLLTGGIYSVTARRSFSQLKLDELEGRVEQAVRSYAYFTRKQMDSTSFNSFINETFNNWNVSVYIYDGSGRLLNENANQEIIEVLSPLVPMVLGGEKVRAVPEISLFAQGSVMLGVPAAARIDDTLVVFGAVFLVQPLTEMQPALTSMMTALMSTMLIVTALMMLFSSMASQRFARPIKQMRDIALDMAEGDFNARANETSRDEIGQLGRSLNYLASQLSHTINELVLERNRLQSILNGLTEGIVALDAEGNVTHINPALCRIFGVTPEMLDEDLRREDIVDDRSLWQDFDVCIANSMPVLRSYTLNDDIYRLTISPLMNNCGQGNMAAGAVALFYDNTQTEKLEQTRREYVANVSHELRTPISAVRGLAEALNDGLIKDESRRMQYYGHILRESMRMSRLIDDLLELSRLQTGSTSVELSCVPLASALEDIVDRYRVRAEELDVKLVLTEGAANAPDVCSNADRIEQVVIILLDNALKFTPDESAITIDAVWNAHTVMVSVRDEGEGIEPQDLEHIFDRFYKADKAHSGKGTGLGLAIAREALGRMGETIEAANSPDGGAVFTFTLKRWKDCDGA